MEEEHAEFVYVLTAERFAVLVRVYGEFARIELDFEDGSAPISLKRAQLATPGTPVKVPGGERPLHVQLLRAFDDGTKGPLLIWLGKTRLLAYLADESETPEPVIVVITNVTPFTRPDGQLDGKKVRADAERMTALAARIQKGFEPGEAE